MSLPPSTCTCRSFRHTSVGTGPSGQWSHRPELGRGESLTIKQRHGRSSGLRPQTGAGRCRGPVLETSLRESREDWVVHALCGTTATGGGGGLATPPRRQFPVPLVPVLCTSRPRRQADFPGVAELRVLAAGGWSGAVPVLSSGEHWSSRSHSGWGHRRHRRGRAQATLVGCSRGVGTTVASCSMLKGACRCGNRVRGPCLADQEPRTRKLCWRAVSARGCRRGRCPR